MAHEPLSEPAGAPQDTCVARVPIFSLLSHEDQLAVASFARPVDLERGQLLSGTTIDLAPVRELGLLTAKPFIFVFNVDEAVLTDPARKAELAEIGRAHV